MLQLTWISTLFNFQVHLIGVQDRNEILSWRISFAIVSVVTLELLCALTGHIELLTRVLKQNRRKGSMLSTFLALVH